MLNWVHCHRCCAFHEKNKDLIYFLAECGHIFCENCFKYKDASSVCIICKKKSGIIKLDRNIDPSIRSFFNPLESQFKKCLEISNFQNSNRDSLILRFTQKYENAKEQLIKQATINRRLLQENKMLRTMLRNSTQHKKPVSSTPNDYNDASFQNITASTITPSMIFRFGSNKKTATTPMNNYPGVAKKLCTTNSNQSFVGHRISPPQVVPKVLSHKVLAPIHKSNVGTMSSWQDILNRTKTMKL
ncbi:hypothetical protein WA026_022015 [Henosepilachna vigintioctopunctata]|uniref:RING-type domain-containing protein n=1 Tax=Henosepilachna vigintioctopunctata TaxID=420089 RepID=A0AAW1V594_9CUCU